MPDDILARPHRRQITSKAVGIGLATGAYGLSFGAISVASGLDAWQTQALSLLMFTGGSQFALVGVLGAGGGAVAAVLTAWLLGRPQQRLRPQPRPGADGDRARRSSPPPS